jgi:hypothetical protein
LPKKSMRLPATLAAFLTCIWWLAPWLATLAAGLLLVGTGGSACAGHAALPPRCTSKEAVLTRLSAVLPVLL